MFKCLACQGEGFLKKDFADSSTSATDGRLGEFRSAATKRLCQPILFCNSCGLGRVFELPSQQILSDAYSQAVDEVHSSQWSYRVQSFERALIHISRVCGVNFAKTQWLDVGSAGGAFLEAALRQEIDIYGVEPARHLVESSPPPIRDRMHAGTLQSDTHFDLDVISYWDVLEHLESPAEELALAHERLRTNGLLILNLPMVDTLSASLLRRRWPFYLSVHLWYFTETSVRSLLQREGYQVEKVLPYSQTLSMGYVVRRALNLTTEGREFSKVPIRYRMGQRTIVASKM